MPQPVWILVCISFQQEFMLHLIPQKHDLTALQLLSTVKENSFPEQTLLSHPLPAVSECRGISRFIDYWWSPFNFFFEHIVLKGFLFVSSPIMSARCWSCCCGCVLVTPKQIHLMSKELKADGANWSLRCFSSHWCWLATVRLDEKLLMKLNLTCRFVGGHWPPSRKNDGEDHKQPFRPAQGSSWKATSVLHNESSHHNINGLHHHISAAQR